MAARPSRPRRFQRVEEVSAGGVVVDRPAPDARAALIGRVDKRGRLLWSLPKGHVEAGESAVEAAVREVEEETGIHGTPLGELGTIDYWFVADGSRVHKTVHHYLLVAESGSLGTSDVEVDEVAWVPLAEAADRLAYADEKVLVGRVAELLG